MDNLLYHESFNGDRSVSDTRSISSESASSTNTVRPAPPSFDWDLQSNYKSLFPVFHYISSKLQAEGLSIALVISNQDPGVIPVWHLPQRSQIILTRIIRKACSRFDVSPNWMTVLASITDRRHLPSIFEAYKPGSYLIRRSIIQNEVVFSCEGLTLLSIDHIYTLKRMLSNLSESDCEADLSREACLASSMHLLHRINAIHNGIKISKGYVERVYTEVPFQACTMDEVAVEYDANFCTASILAVSPGIDFNFFDETAFDLECTDSPTAELSSQSISDMHSPVSDTEALGESVSPMTDDNPTTTYSWGQRLEKIALIDRPALKIPELRTPSHTHASAHGEIWHREIPFSPLSVASSWGPDAPPSPLKVKVTKPSSQMPEMEQLDRAQISLLEAIERASRLYRNQELPEELPIVLIEDIGNVEETELYEDEREEAFVEMVKRWNEEVLASPQSFVEDWSSDVMCHLGHEYDEIPVRLSVC